MAKYTLSKKERLKSEKVISALFEKGQHLKVFPLKIIYLETKIGLTQHPLLFSVTVPKKLIKKASDRNLIKRRIREAYRLNCHNVKSLISHKEKQFSIMFIYMKNEITDSSKIAKVMVQLLDKLEKKMQAI